MRTLPTSTLYHVHTIIIGIGQNWHTNTTLKSHRKVGYKTDLLYTKKRYFPRILSKDSEERATLKLQQGNKI